ncbi:MAG: hypothetical protein NTX23_05230 [Candidatus Bipolaricaulota bacterium]|jgi:hypothetical protein|nr:hypothetical protein [Candidatus Bipolaricaulota bacterium]
MRLVVVVVLGLLLVGAPVLAEQSALSFAAEFGAGALTATVSFEWVLSLTFQVYPQARHPQASALGGASNVLLGLAVTPLAAGATVTCVGWLFGVTGKYAGLASVLAASVSELFALRAWDLDLPEWLAALAVPVVTSLGATIGFTLQANAQAGGRGSLIP